VVAIGGSATNDAGAGALQALGAELFGGAAPIGPGGAALEGLTRIDLAGLDPRLGSVELLVACDVTNPLCGPRGASAVFGPQKGASPADVVRLDAALRRFADVLRRDAGLDVADVSGAGAAGGLGAALLACGGRLVPGVDLVLEALRFEERVRGATVVLTGEGRIDGQTPHGKAVAGVVARAARAGVPVIALAGRVEPGFESLYAQGLLSVHGILRGPAALPEALATAEADLEAAAEAVARVVARWA
jgi:glycerate 2-kinase